MAGLLASAGLGGRAEGRRLGHPRRGAGDLRGDVLRVVLHPAQQGGAAGVLPGEPEEIETGHGGNAAAVLDQVAAAVGSVADLGALGEALAVALGLWRHDRVRGMARTAALGSVIAAAVVRLLWLVEGVHGGPSPADLARLTAVVARVAPVGDAPRPGTLTMTWSNAGHPPPMLLPARGRALVLASEPTDLILGVIPEVPRVQHQVELGPGDTVLLYSDGLIERRDRDLDEGLAELGAVLTELSGLPLADLCERLLERLVVKGHEDDIAIIAVRLR